MAPPISTYSALIFQKEQWTFYSQCPGDTGRGSYDEELYVNGCTVVWSRGGQDGCRAVVKTFTMETPVVQVCTSV